MRRAGCNILNGVGCNRNKMCFDMSDDFEPPLTCSFARVRALIERDDREELITILLLKNQALERIFILGTIKRDSHILVC